MKKSIVTIGLVLLTSHAAPLYAGIADSPIPPLSGQKALHLYSVSGVVNAGGLGTFVSCTNASSVAAVVAVEVFTDIGQAPCNSASDNAISLDPGVTVMFASQNFDSSFFSTMPMMSVPLYIPLGSLRVLSTQKALVCTAFLADAYSSPPASMTPLNVVARTKQRGD